MTSLYYRGQELHYPTWSIPQLLLLTRRRYRKQNINSHGMDYVIQKRYSGVMMGAMASQIIGVCVFVKEQFKEIRKLRFTDLSAGNSPVTDAFPSQRASSAKMFPFDDVIMFSGHSTGMVEHDWTSLITVSHERHGVSNLWQIKCIFKSLFILIGMETSNVPITGPLWRNPSVTDGFPSQRNSNAEGVSYLWRHHGQTSFYQTWGWGVFKGSLLCRADCWKTHEEDFTGPKSDGLSDFGRVSCYLLIDRLKITYISTNSIFSEINASSFGEYGILIW